MEAVQAGTINGTEEREPRFSKVEGLNLKNVPEAGVISQPGKFTPRMGPLTLWDVGYLSKVTRLQRQADTQSPKQVARPLPGPRGALLCARAGASFLGLQGRPESPPPGACPGGSWLPLDGNSERLPPAGTNAHLQLKGDALPAPLSRWVSQSGPWASRVA